MVFYLRKKNVLLSELVVEKGEKSVENIDLRIYTDTSVINSSLWFLHPLKK